MHPAFSVIFLTTLIGAGQGLFLALFTVESYAAFGLLPPQSDGFYAIGSGIAMALLVFGLIASFFHLGHPERAWRAATQWRTSWLSREVIALPAFMGTVFFYGIAHWTGFNPELAELPSGALVNITAVLGTLGTVLAFTLYICTGMIYACLKFLREWHTPLTVINYILLAGFAVPLVLLGLGLAGTAAGALMLAFVVQYFGLLAERWFFFAQANHPQNLYYQSVA